MPPKVEKIRTQKRYFRTSIELKKELISKWEGGRRLTDLSKEYGMVKSTICTILKNRSAIKKSNVARGVKILSANRSPVMEEMEKLLLVWIEEKQAAGDIISEPLICERAKQLHTELSLYIPHNEDFKGSKGWFDKFKKRIGIHSVVRYDDTNISNSQDSKQFTDLQNYINKVSLMPSIDCNVDDSIVSKKKNGKKTFVFDENNILKEPIKTVINNEMAVKYIKVAENSQNPIVSKDIEIPLDGEGVSDGDITSEQVKELFFHWTKTQSLLIKLHPDIALVDSNINSFNCNVVKYFKDMLTNNQIMKSPNKGNKGNNSTVIKLKELAIK